MKWWRDILGSELSCFLVCFENVLTVIFRTNVRALARGARSLYHPSQLPVYGNTAVQCTSVFWIARGWVRYGFVSVYGGPVSVQYRYGAEPYSQEASVPSPTSFSPQFSNSP